MRIVLKKRWIAPIVLGIAIFLLWGYKLRSGYLESRKYAEERTLVIQLRVMRDAIDNFRAKTGRCPSSLQELTDTQYLRGIPVDPFVRTSNSWRYVPDQMACDVKSSSTLLARDGTRYADWHP
jgi:general secretion pathway protein G